MFYPDHSATSQSEFIFAIPYDPSPSDGYMFYGRYDLNRNLGMKYGYSGATVGSNINPIVNQTTGNGLVNSKPSGPRATLSSFLNYFLPDPNDIRLDQWLYGPQYWSTGAPVRVQTTKLGYDQFYGGSDGSSAYIYGFKTNTDTYRRIFPIPTVARTANSKLEQNPGY